MRRRATMGPPERIAPGMILLGLGAALTLFNLVAVFLMIRGGDAFRGLAMTGLWLLAAYAVVGAVVALALGAGRRRARGAATTKKRFS